MFPLLLYVLAFSFSSRGYWASEVWLYYIPSFMMILSYALAEASSADGRKGIGLRLLATKQLLRLGEWSFSFYMIHNLVILIVQRLWRMIFAESLWELRALVSILVAVLASYLVYEFFEQPLTRFFSRQLFADKVKKTR